MIDNMMDEKYRSQIDQKNVQFWMKKSLFQKLNSVKINKSPQ